MTLETTTHNPDVLSCLANLSNDEVFTPPAVANAMLDLLPPELFRSPETTFLDPVCKSGVFLREIAKRLIAGLAETIPDLQRRVDHIFHRQLFGIAITEMTSLLARRSVYCSKYPNSRYSVTEFPDVVGNIRFKSLRHTWENGKCVFCDVNQKKETYTRKEMEIHAYEYIHTIHPERIFEMKFDVIVGNPPYQLNVGIEKEDYAMPIYQKFVEQSKKLNPRFLVMIIPSRWYAGGRGLDDFRKSMLSDNKIKELHDFVNPEDCFPGVQIKGGVCYFLWQSDYNGNCKIVSHDNEKVISSLVRPLLEPGIDTFIRHNNAITILRKVINKQHTFFSDIVSPQTPFGLITSFKDYKKTPFKNSIKFYTTKAVGYIDISVIPNHKEWVYKPKIYISKAYGAGEGYPHQIINKPFLGESGSCCSQTYLLIGPFDNENICSNVISYIKTKFFRFMVMLKKNSQDAMRGVYSFVPLQDFSKPWTDAELYDKYGLNDEEIAFIESMIRPMDGDNDGESE